MKILLFFFLFLSGYTAVCQEIKTQTITVEPYMAIYNDAFFKIMTIKSTDSDADHIDGFDFTWGYSYSLKIRVEKLKYPPEDGSSINYSLIKVLSKNRVSDSYEFKMGLYKDLYLGGDEQVNNFKLINDSTYSYFDKIEIEIPFVLKPEFLKIFNDNQNRIGYFTFISEKKIKLVRFD